MAPPAALTGNVWRTLFTYGTRTTVGLEPVPGLPGCSCPGKAAAGPGTANSCPGCPHTPTPLGLAELCAVFCTLLNMAHVSHLPLPPLAPPKRESKATQCLQGNPLPPGICQVPIAEASPALQPHHAHASPSAYQHVVLLLTPSWSLFPKIVFCVSLFVPCSFLGASTNCQSFRQLQRAFY